MRKETDRVLALNLQKAEEVARQELEIAAKERLGEPMEQAADVPRGPEVPKTPNLRSRSAKKSPVVKPAAKGIVAWMAAAMGRR